MTMQMWLLPPWVRITWIAVLTVAAALHHPKVMDGQRRYWHVGHVLMAAGMAYMYLPHAVHLVPAIAGVALYGTVTGVAAGTAAWYRRRDGVWQLLWILIAIEMAAMTYMFLPMAAVPRTGSRRS